MMTDVSVAINEWEQARGMKNAHLLVGQKGSE